MATILFLNNYQTTLGAALSSTATSLTVSSTTGLPSSLASGQFIPMTLTPASSPGSAYEIVYVTGISGSSLTVTRGEEGTSALNWNTGDILYSTNTAQTTGTSMGSPSTDFQTNTLTASGLITANDGINVAQGAITARDGLSVPSGTATVAGTLSVTGTETVSGTLEVTGTVTIPNATANDEPVAKGQLLQTDPLNWPLAEVSSGTSLSTTSPTYTAPCNGFFFVWADGIASADASGCTISASLSGFVLSQGTGEVQQLSASGYLPVTTGQSSTVTLTVTTSARSSISLVGRVLVFPTP